MELADLYKECIEKDVDIKIRSIFKERGKPSVAVQVSWYDPNDFSKNYHIQKPVDVHEFENAEVLLKRQIGELLYKLKEGKND